MTDGILLKFWDLLRSQYKREVYKIITEASYKLKTPHKEFLFN